MYGAVFQNSVTCALVCTWLLLGCNLDPVELETSAEVCLTSDAELIAIQDALKQYRKLNNSGGVQIIDHTASRTKRMSQIMADHGTIERGDEKFIWFVAVYEGHSAITVYSSIEDHRHVLFNFYRLKEARLMELNRRFIIDISRFQKVRFSNVEWMTQEYRIQCKP